VIWKENFRIVTQPPGKRKVILPEERVIFHVDMDSFYASCELARRPEFRDVPFVVGADPKEGQGRGVVLSCNYPARKFGIRSGMPISRAWELCKEAKYTRPDFALYERVSGNVMGILRKYSRVEQVSIDEAYIDFSEQMASNKGNSRKEAITALASSIRQEIRKAENIPCSIGVANSKIVAKIATDMAKPDGIRIVEPENVDEFLGPLPVGKIPGVGRVSQRALLDAFKVSVIEDLRKIPLEDLKDKFGRTALWLKNVASGIDESEVVTNWEPVSQSGETTFETDEHDYSKIDEVMLEVAKDVHRRTVNDGYLFRSVGIKIRFTGFETHTRSRTLSALTDSFSIVAKECERMLSEFSSSGRTVRLIGVRLSNLERIAPEQHKLVEWTG
jgi:DNA polymerase IV (archaeal DinB-like DNA polymerase)